MGSNESIFISFDRYLKPLRIANFKHSMRVFEISQFILSSYPSIAKEEFKLVFGNRVLMKSNATLGDYGICSNQTIKCIRSRLVFNNAVSCEQILICADNIIKEMNKSIDCLNVRVANIKSKIEAISSITKLQQMRSGSGLMTEINEITQIVLGCRKLDKINKLKNKLNGQTHITRIDCISKKIKELDDTYHALLQNTQHQETLNDIIQQKIDEFEELRLKWTAEDVICWIRLIEDGHFESLESYKPFFVQLRIMKVDGKQLPEMNSKLLLHMMGLNEKNQSILLRNICRVSKIWEGSKRRDLCGLCMENRIDAAIVPCGHQYACYQCLNENGIKKCPICRVQISQKIKVFMNGF